jgi:hypothetical protein
MKTGTRVTMVLAAGALFVAARTSTASQTTTTETPPTTTLAPTTTTTTLAPTTTTTMTTPPPLEPPRTGDTSDVAADAFRFPPEYSVVLNPTEADIDLVGTFDEWVPLAIVDGITVAIFTDEDDNRIVVLSIIPLSGLRANPWISYHFATAADENIEVPDVANDVLEVESLNGGIFYLWSEGDGVMITASDNNDAARRYLETRKDLDEPNPVWTTGDCLYLPQGQLDVVSRMPYAPFSLDIVAPCSGPHNAEVLLAEFTGTDLDEFDGMEIAYLRSYRCDEAYAQEFDQSQDEYLPAMITYMPDIDEFARGDRYIACVVLLNAVGDAEVLFEGPMADLPDLERSLEVGVCIPSASKLEINCNASHQSQFLGSVTVDFETYPSFDSSDFDDACAEFDTDLVEGTGTDAEAIVFATWIQPYQFELGARTTNCFAAAVIDDFFVDVAGSFFDQWSEVGQGAEAA